MVEFTSQQLARAAGVTQRALRHYLQIGLMEEPGRTWSGYR
ncbi:MAG: MerR family DNA-binding transcriptional regulator, partial [Bifidobacteriaceae bacterium]|nr:MerR family DNA-binding transcriptional regulator [Bifidobacteriaceae bacterium]